MHEPAVIALGGGRWETVLTPTTVLLELFTLGAILALAVGLHLTVELPARRWLRRRLSLRGARKPSVERKRGPSGVPTP